MGDTGNVQNEDGSGTSPLRHHCLPRCFFNAHRKSMRRDDIGNQEEKVPHLASKEVVEDGRRPPNRYHYRYVVD